VTVSLPRARLGLAQEIDLVCVPLGTQAPPIEPDPGSGPDVVRFTLTVGPAACLVVRIEPAGAVA
jgi:hypothetical protein